MGKAKRERVLSESEAKAVVRNLKVSPQKLNLLAQMIRGKKVDTALADLEFSRKRIAQDVRKCVMSAVANAENNHGLDVNDLVVKEAYVGKNLVITDRKSTRLNSSHSQTSYAVFCLKKKKTQDTRYTYFQ